MGSIKAGGFEMKKKCIFTATSKQNLEKLINQFFYSENYYIDEQNQIRNKKTNFQTDWIVEVKDGRWRIFKLDN